MTPLLLLIALWLFLMARRRWLGLPSKTSIILSWLRGVLTSVAR